MGERAPTPSARSVPRISPTRVSSSPSTARPSSEAGAGRGRRENSSSSPWPSMLAFTAGAPGRFSPGCSGTGGPPGSRWPRRTPRGGGFARTPSRGPTEAMGGGCRWPPFCGTCVVPCVRQSRKRPRGHPQRAGCPRSSATLRAADRRRAGSRAAAKSRPACRSARIKAQGRIAEVPAGTFKLASLFQVCRENLPASFRPGVIDHCLWNRIGP